MLVFWFSYLTPSSTNVVHLDIRVIFLYVCCDLCVLLVKLTSVLVMPIKILNLESITVFPLKVIHAAVSGWWTYITINWNFMGLSCIPLDSSPSITIFLKC